MKLGIVAGEASGDIWSRFNKVAPPVSTYLTATGVGGKAMMAEGFNSLYDIDKLSVMGLIEPLFHLPELIKIRSGLSHHFLQNRPDVFIGIDSPDFNLGLELKLRKANIPVVHYVVHPYGHGEESASSKLQKRLI